jgi:hypothetical protein
MLLGIPPHRLNETNTYLLRICGKSFARDFFALNAIIYFIKIEFLQSEFDSHITQS